MGRFVVKYIKEKDLSIAEHSGDCTVEDVANGIKKYYEGPTCKFAITDFTNTSPAGKVTGEEISHLSECMHKASAARTPNSYDLIVVPDLLMYGLARMYATYLNLSAKNETDLKTEVFHSLEDALHWVDTRIKLSL